VGVGIIGLGWWLGDRGFRTEYIHEPTDKEYLFLHHSAGWNNSYKTVDGWAKDDRRTWFNWCS